MATLNELGQKVKAKYPGQYDDISDDELGRKIQAKYPGQYDDFTGTAAPSDAPYKPTAFDRFMSRGNIEGGLKQVDDFGNSVRDLFTGDDKIGNRVGNVISNIPFIGGPLTESARALNRLQGIEPKGDMARDILRAVPIVGPMIQQPFESLAAGQVPESAGDALNLFLMSKAIPRVESPYVQVETPLGPGLSKPAGPSRLPEIPQGLKTAAEWLLPHKVQKLAGQGYDIAREKTAQPAKTTEIRWMNRDFPDTTISPESYRAMAETEAPRTVQGIAPEVSQYGRGAHSVLPEVEVGGATIPDMVIDENAINRARPLKWKRIHEPITPSKPPRGAKRGQYDAAKKVIPDVEVGGATIPDFTFPGISPEALLAKIADKKTAESVTNVKAFLDTPEGMKKVTVPEAPPKPVKSIRDTGMAAQMRARDAALASDAEKNLPGGVAITPAPGKTKLDMALDKVRHRENEATFDVRDYSEADKNRIIDAAQSRGLDASSDGKFILVRDMNVPSPAQGLTPGPSANTGPGTGSFATDFKTKAKGFGVHDRHISGSEESGLTHGLNTTNKNTALLEFAKARKLPTVAMTEAEYNMLVEGYNAEQKRLGTGKRYKKAGADHDPRPLGEKTRHGRSVDQTLKEFNEDWAR